MLNFQIHLKLKQVIKIEGCHERSTMACKPLQTISCKRQPLTTITAASIMAIDDVSGFFSSSNFFNYLSL
jgi:hypothetical protein